MLTTFPQLLDYTLVSPFLLRISIGILGLIVAKMCWSKANRWVSIPYGVVGVLLIIGLYTQIASIIGLILSNISYFFDKKSMSISKEYSIIYGLTFIILISLLFTGPGILAFDLPL